MVPNVHLLIFRPGSQSPSVSVSEIVGKPNHPRFFPQTLCICKQLFLFWKHPINSHRNFRESKLRIGWKVPWWNYPFNTVNWVTVKALDYGGEADIWHGIRGYDLFSTVTFFYNISTQEALWKIFPCVVFF